MHCMIQRNKEYWRAREVYDTVGKPLLWHSASKAVSSPGRLWMESSELLITGHKAIPPFRHSTIFYGIQYIPYCSCQVNLWLVRVSNTANLPSRPSPLASFLLFFARILRILHGVQACQSTKANQDGPRCHGVDSTLAYSCRAWIHGMLWCIRKGTLILKSCRSQGSKCHRISVTFYNSHKLFSQSWPLHAASHLEWTVTSFFQTSQGTYEINAFNSLRHLNMQPLEQKGLLEKLWKPCLRHGLLVV